MKLEIICLYPISHTLSKGMKTSLFIMLLPDLNLPLCSEMSWFVSLVFQSCCVFYIFRGTQINHLIL